VFGALDNTRKEGKTGERKTKKDIPARCNAASLKALSRARKNVAGKMPSREFSMEGSGGRNISKRTCASFISRREEERKSGKIEGKRGGGRPSLKTLVANPSVFGELPRKLGELWTRKKETKFRDAGKNLRGKRVCKNRCPSRMPCRKKGTTQDDNGESVETKEDYDSGTGAIN